MRLLGAIWLSFCLVEGRGQNVIEDRATGPTAPPMRISETQALALVNFRFETPQTGRGAEPVRLARKLDQHVTEFLNGAPWMPFQHTLGISGYEVYFNHSDEMFYALSLALPFLPKDTAARTKTFLAQELTRRPPYSVDGFDNRTGHAREAYAVPADLRLNGLGKARSAFGVYAFWAYVHATGDTAAAKAHWLALQERLQPLTDAPYKFDPARHYTHDEAEILNADLAGLIAMARLARTNTGWAVEKKTVRRARELFELRVNLERVNPRILETTDSSTKHLHTGKLARFCALTPEVGEAIRTLTDGCGAAHLKDFRQARNAWYLAFGDRMVGGENYTNPLHFSHALFDGALFVEQLPPEQIASFVDVPWCRGDFFFIEKCALALSVMR